MKDWILLISKLVWAVLITLFFLILHSEVGKFYNIMMERTKKLVRLNCLDVINNIIIPRQHKQLLVTQTLVGKCQNIASSNQSFYNFLSFYLLLNYKENYNLTQANLQ